MTFSGAVLFALIQMQSLSQNPILPNEHKKIEIMETIYEKQENKDLSIGCERVEWVKENEIVGNIYSCPKNRFFIVIFNLHSMQRFRIRDVQIF